jgi:hypothetical protein
MRTTVTLDPDVAARLRATMRERDVSFKVALNDALRRGLGQEADAARPFAVRPLPLGLRPHIDADRALELAAGLEDAEILRRLALRK